MSKWLRMGVAVAMLASGAAQAEGPGEAGGPLERSADVLLIGVPALALGLTWVLDAQKKSEGAAGFGTGFLGFDFTRMNGSPRHDLSLAMMRSVAVTYGLKLAVKEERPNGKEGSFPSAHTSMTFTGAEFIREQYGWGWGAPAYAAASYVGWSRVQTQHHWWHDVAAGAAIGILSNHNLSLGAVKIRPIFLPSGDTPYKNLVGPADPFSSSPGLSLQFHF